MENRLEDGKTGFKKTSEEAILEVREGSGLG